jgi:uridine kinase
LLQTHLNAFSDGALHIAKPLVNYNENYIGEETIDWNGVRFLLIEGTYSFFLKNADFKIFMKRTYHDTRQQRLARGREADDPFIENVLEIEHRIIAPLGEKANAIVNKDYTISIIKK